MALWLVGGGYLLGSILPAEWLVRRRIGTSPQAQGINPGAVSTFKLVGVKAGLLVVLLDLVKGIIPIALAGVMEVQGIWYALVAAAPVIGHNWPIWRFARGGRGVATVTGALLWLSWRPILVAYLMGAPLILLYPRWLPAVALVALPLGYALMHAHRLPREQLAVAFMLISLVGVRQLPWLWAKLRQHRSRTQETSTP